MANSKRARNENDVCGNLERGPGERSSGGNNTMTGPYAGSWRNNRCRLFEVGRLPGRYWPEEF